MEEFSHRIFNLETYLILFKGKALQAQGSVCRGCQKDQKKANVAHFHFINYYHPLFQPEGWEHVKNLNQSGVTTILFAALFLHVHRGVFFCSLITLTAFSVPLRGCTGRRQDVTFHSRKNLHFLFVKRLCILQPMKDKVRRGQYFLLTMHRPYGVHCVWSPW